MTTVPVYESPMGDHVYVCPLCGRPGAHGESCDSGLHDPPENVEMVPSTAVAMAYRAYRRAEAVPRAGQEAVGEVDVGTVEAWENGTTSPPPAQMLAIADALGRPLHWFFVDHERDEPLSASAPACP